MILHHIYTAAKTPFNNIPLLPPPPHSFAAASMPLMISVRVTSLPKKIILLLSDKDYWLAEMKGDLEDTLKARTQNLQRAKNVIIFVGDGMGLPVITASRIYKGQKNGKTGEETVLRFEKFPSTGLIKVPCFPFFNKLQ